MLKGKNFDLIIVGGGPGGMASAIRAYELGVKNILLIDRNPFLGGILPQCIHSGFGLKVFVKELTGPEYAQRLIDMIKNTSITVLLNTMVLSIDNMNNVVFSNKNDGIKSVKTKAIILALGCRERTRGAINIPGDRPSGIFTAGFVQRMVNIEGYLPGKDIVILGSGDIGLIMARRLKLEGCNVIGVYEVMPFCSGLRRNIVQCLNDFDIPLMLSHTITRIYGRRRLEGVEISRVDKNLNLVPSSSFKVSCDTLVLSVGLIPENEISKASGIQLDANTNGPVVDENFKSSAEGIFTCGNSVFVNDLADNVTEDGFITAKRVVKFLSDGSTNDQKVNIISGENVAYTVPQRISGHSDVIFRIRSRFPVRNAYVEIPEIEFKKKERYVIPSELIFIKVKKEEFSRFYVSNNKTITVNIVESK
jgi:NADPH-dependent 2,4-dienoyl-CoA reductase/sulfur reductase-like enzyme